jgi:hypothetical protein
MSRVDKAYSRLEKYSNRKTFKLTAAHDDSATLVNNLSAISGQCNNIVGIIAEIQAAKESRDGDAIDKGLDKLKTEMREFMSVSRIAKSEMLNYLKPMIKN